MQASIRWKIAQWLEIRWWKRYLSNQEVDTYLAWKLQYWEGLLHLISEHLQLREGGQILDAGCGPAGIFMVLKQQRVDAIDPLLQKYDELDHFNRTHYYWVNFIEGGLENLDSSEGKYDVIFCMNAINHVNDIEKSIGHLYRCLKPKGKLILSTDSHRFTALKHLFRAIPGDALHPHQYSIKEYLRLVERAGFEIEHRQIIKPGKVFNYELIVAKRS